MKSYYYNDFKTLDIQEQRSNKKRKTEGNADVVSILTRLYIFIKRYSYVAIHYV